MYLPVSVCIILVCQLNIYLKNGYNSVNFPDDELKMWVLVAESLSQPTLCMQRPREVSVQNFDVRGGRFIKKAFHYRCTVFFSEFEPIVKMITNICV